MKEKSKKILTKEGLSMGSKKQKEWAELDASTVPRILTHQEPVQPYTNFLDGIKDIVDEGTDVGQDSASSSDSCLSMTIASHMRHHQILVLV